MQANSSKFEMRASSPSASPGGRRFTRAGPGRWRPALLVAALLAMIAGCGIGESIEHATDAGAPWLPIPTFPGNSTYGALYVSAPGATGYLPVQVYGLVFDGGTVAPGTVAAIVVISGH